MRSIADLESKAHEIKELQRMKEELEAEITALQDEIKAELTERSTDNLVAGAYKINWKSSLSSRLDTKALKADLPDIAAKYTKETQTMRFSIT